MKKARVILVLVLVLAVPLEIPEVGNYKATATSIAAATGHLGAFVIPTFAIAPIVERWGFSAAFAASTALLALGALFVLLLEETGWRASHHRQHP